MKSPRENKSGHIFARVEEIVIHWVPIATNRLRMPVGDTRSSFNRVKPLGVLE